MPSTPQEKLQELKDLVQRHETWRENTLNLIASENALSPAVRSALVNDWLGRYADFTGRDLSDRRYQGTRFMVEIEEMVVSLVKSVFKADFVEIRATAGHLAGVAVLMGLCQPGDTILELGRSSGGHREASKTNLPSLINLNTRFLPFDGERYNIDVEATEDLIRETRPKLVILGSSNFLFPHPVRKIKNALETHCPEGHLIYDASHVLGLIAGGEFQDPLREGADLVFSSTHKTFPGPQGGIIFTNREALIHPVSEAIYPALVTNHHSFRMPALAAALLEMQVHGKDYAKQVIENAQALGSALSDEEIPCVCVDGRYSQSHTVLVKSQSFGPNQALARRLEDANIICTASGLPESQGGAALRLGVQELTHHGAGPADMKHVAGCIADVLHERLDLESVRHKVANFSSRLGSIYYTFERT
jgi:glycine hydroxymethyltransferase